MSGQGPGLAAVAGNATQCLGYFVDPISRDEAEEALGLATALVGQLLAEGRA